VRIAVRGEQVLLPQRVSRYIVPASEVSFTADDLAIWASMLRRTAASLERVDSSYGDGFAAAAFDPRHVPTLDELRSRLAEVGWTAVYVDGYMHSKAYAFLLANSILPIARNVRSAAQLEYSPTPDMFHDLIGHIPTLFCPEFSAYVRRWAQIALAAQESPLDHELYRANRTMSLLMSDPASSAEEVRAAQNRAIRCSEAAVACPSEMLQLSRIFLWSVEFGLLGSFNEYRIIGSGLISSPKELRRLAGEETRLLDYSMDVIHHDIQFSDLQSYYFVAPSYDAYNEILEAYAHTMK
jgi:phenylalanine-4-hydroxylase